MHYVQMLCESGFSSSVHCRVCTWLGSTIVFVLAVHVNMWSAEVIFQPSFSIPTNINRSLIIIDLHSLRYTYSQYKNILNNIHNFIWYKKPIFLSKNTCSISRTLHKHSKRESEQLFRLKKWKTLDFNYKQPILVLLKQM